MTFHRALSWSRLPLVALAFYLAAAVLAQPLLSADSQVQLRFKNGDYVSGVLVDCQEANHIGINSDAFETPLIARVDRVGSLERKEELLPGQPDEYSFVLSNHSTLVGKLIAMTEESVTIRSRSLGEVTFPRPLLNEMVESAGVGKLLFVGPRSSQTWKSEPKSDAWTLEGGALATSLAGHPIQCDLQMPDLCEVRVKLSWTKFPGFMLALGTQAGLPANKQREPASVRIESWGTSLTMVRSGAAETDFVALGELSQDGGRIDLVLYIDDTKGEVTACAPTGKVLGRVLVADKNVANASMMKLLNTSQGKDALRLERIQVRQWNGRLPGQANMDNGGVVDRQGNRIPGKIEQFDADKQTITVVGEDKSNSTIELSKLGRALFQTEAAAQGASTEPPDDALEVQLADGSTCVAVWKSSKDGKVELVMDGLSQPLNASFDHLIALSGNGTSIKDGDLPARAGSLQNDQLKLLGCLSDSSAPGALFWQPMCAAKPAQLRPEFEGKIVYEAEPPKATAPAKARADANGGMGMMGGVVILGMGGMGGQAKPAKEEAKATTVYAGLKSRTGDVVVGKVEKIDENGVTFQMGDRTVVAAHASVDSVTLVDRARVLELPPEKLKQLMTIPRAAKPDPPTHLFVSVNGDYLRGRLIKYIDGRVTAEIRLESVEFPAGAIAQVVWLYSRDWDDKKPVAKADPDDKPKIADDKQPEQPQAAGAAPTLLQVYALQKNDKAVTFTPTKTSFQGEEKYQVLQGQNELLGECEVRISEVKSLLVGRDVGAIARKMQKDAWRLSVATLPKVYQEGDQTSESGGSPLVGKPAPNFELKTTSDDKFALSKLKGKVTVLDFWASWCGPCMQTMPEVDRIVEEVGGDEVQLVAVNLQESKERALAAVKRLDLTATVVLDEDGEVAQKYEASAIPQTVIIDREGTVTHLFVGGGPKFLKQFEEALKAALKQEK